VNTVAEKSENRRCLQKDITLRMGCFTSLDMGVNEEERKRNEKEREMRNKEETESCTQKN